MQIEARKKYITQDGYVILAKMNSLPTYKISAEKVWKIEGTELVPENLVWSKEVWRLNGVAYHDDCYCNLIAEFETMEVNAFGPCGGSDEG